MTNNKIKIRGKHLAALQTLCDSITAAPYPVAVPDHVEVVSATISGMQSGRIDKGTAASIILGKIDEAVFELFASNTFPFDDEALSRFKIKIFERLKTTIESLPFTYRLRIELPSFPPLGSASFAITDDIAIVHGPYSFDPPASSTSEALARGLMALDTTSSYLEIKTSGFANQSTDSPALAEALSIAKRCAFILTTFGKFFDKLTARKARCILSSTDANIEFPVELPNSLGRAFGSLIPHPVHLKRTVIDTTSGTSLLGNTLQVPAETQEEKRTVIQNHLRDIFRFFAKRDHPDFSAISAAMEWYQDSIYAENQTFAYLAACIGLEALVGSEDFMDEMSNRLTDRYGFLMGRSRQEREDLANQYRAVLKVRGKLVHAKVARLSGDDHQYLAIAQQLLLNSLWKELHRIYQDAPAV